MIIAKIIGLFTIIFIGYGANKIGWLPISANKHLSIIVINIATPCMVVVTMADAEFTRDKILSILVMFLIGTVCYFVSQAIGFLFNRVTRVPAAERGIFANLLTFTNNGFMGYAIALVFFGREGLFLMVMIGCITPLFVYTGGAINAKKDAAVINGVILQKSSMRSMLKEVLNVPVFAAIIGLIIYFFQIPMPEPVHDVLSSLGAMMTPLAMMVVGLQLTESNAKDIIGNRHTVLMTVMRLVIIPVLFFLIMYPFGMPSLWLAVATLNFLLPSAVILSPVAAQFGANAKRTAEGIFLTTLFSMITIPIAAILLHML